MARLESGPFQPLAAQTNPGFDPAINKITNGFNFQAAGFCTHSFTSLSHTLNFFRLKAFMHMPPQVMGVV